MSNYDREAMVAEATDFGLKFKGNISNIKLAELIAEFKGEPIPVAESAPPSPKTKAEEPEQSSAALTAADAVRTKYERKRKQISDAKEKAFKTHIITLTNKDPRENDVVTTAYLSVHNQHFRISRSVPLDIPVELQQCLINNAETAMMTMHKDEIINGRRTGNKVAIRVKKYAISYSAQVPD